MGKKNRKPFHYIDMGRYENPDASLDEAIAAGETMHALCGKEWAPTTRKGKGRLTCTPCAERLRRIHLAKLRRANDIIETYTQICMNLDANRLVADHDSMAGLWDDLLS